MQAEVVLGEYLPQLLAKMSPTAIDLEVRVIPGGNYPPELWDLRRQVYLDETQWLDEEQLFDGNDEVGKHILLYSKSGELMGATLIAPARLTDFAQHACVEAGFLRNAAYSSRSIVHPNFRRQGLLALLLYLAMREADKDEYQRYVGFVEPGKIPGWKVLRYYQVEDAQVRKVKGADGGSYDLLPIMGEVDESLLRAYLALPEGLQEWVQKNVYLPALTQRVLRRVDRFYQLPFFQQIRSNSLPRVAYIRALSNKYQFVKWTTRILGRAVAMSEDPELRRHYAEHLSGEVNHELWVENDLRYLGVDFDFVRDHWVADHGVLSFMFTQEALSSSRLDPIVFLAVPIAIEAASGFLDKAFVTSLRSNIDRWGYQDAGKACTFFASHVHTDGAVDGHWINTLRVLGPRLQHEKTMQMVEKVVDLVMDSLEKAYGSYSQSLD